MFVHVGERELWLSMPLRCQEERERLRGGEMGNVKGERDSVWRRDRECERRDR